MTMLYSEQDTLQIRFIIGKLSIITDNINKQMLLPVLPRTHSNNKLHKNRYS